MNFLKTSILFLSMAMPCAFSYGSSSLVVFSDDTPDMSLAFTISTHTKVPGKILKPGTYTIHVVDHLRDRVVLRIDNSSGKPETLFLGLPYGNLSENDATGPVAWTGSSQQSALRGFIFPGGNKVEFVYRKDEAVEIAKSTSQKVPAIDPGSEGMPATGDLSHQDMTMVTLWRLSPTEVGPDHQAGIAAERIAPPPAPAAAPVQTASDKPPVTSSQENVPAPGVHKRSAPPIQVAVLHRPALQTLPHTASELPMILLAGISLLSISSGIRWFRLRNEA